VDEQTVVTLIISLGGSVIIALASFGSSMLISRSKASRVYADDLARQLTLVRSQLEEMREEHKNCMAELGKMRDENVDLMRRLFSGQS
jgi:uncharacterized protein (DUF3084 family)